MALSLCAGAMNIARAETWVIADIAIVDLTRDRPPTVRTLVIEDQRIVAVLAPDDARIPRDAPRFDGRGRYVLPGLIDMHVHLFNLSSRRPPNTWTFPLFLAAGVTGVREMNTDAEGLALIGQWREQSARGELLAPRMLAAGIAVRGNSPAQARRQVDAAVAAGADFIKVFSQVPAPQYRAIIHEARRRHVPVEGHAPETLPLLDTTRAGQRTVEHLTQVFEACSRVDEEVIADRVAGVDAGHDEARVLNAFDAGRCKRVARELAKHSQAQVPTLMLPYIEATREQRHPFEDPRFRYLRPDERERWHRFLTPMTPNEQTLARQRWAVARKIVATLHRAGVTLIAGTDAPMPEVYPGFGLQEELRLFVAAGMTPREALYAATLAPARLLGREADLGPIAPGRFADLLVLDADPTRDLSTLGRIAAVVIDGRLLRRADLDEMLEKAARDSRP